MTPITNLQCLVAMERRPPRCILGGNTALDTNQGSQALSERTTFFGTLTDPRLMACPRLDESLPVFPKPALLFPPSDPDPNSPAIIAATETTRKKVTWSGAVGESSTVCSGNGNQWPGTGRKSSRVLCKPCQHSDRNARGHINQGTMDRSQPRHGVPCRSGQTQAGRASLALRRQRRDIQDTRDPREDISSGI
jgi:hypothetical protein